ncbi:MAG: pyridoxamine 5'-phosphate oxidase [Verrucomicrobia bacterium]|nr:pyridoxamine 5'-phosphate oxidase [Verrucomicrobiota bacterium]
MRRQYNPSALREETMLADPLEQFTAWFRDAISAGVVEPNAMSLATAGADGRPLVRSVLLKHYDARGFVFFTNLESRKARQLRENPQAALLLPWLLLERQVVITGPVERLTVAETLKYFVTRPRDSQIAAWASKQSSPLSSRKVLELEWEAFKRKFSAGEVPLPDFWGGFRVVPEALEFWQGGANRLHDRILYTRLAAGRWQIGRLAP